MEEISLKEIIVVLLKGKKWVLLTTVFFTAAALAYGLLQPKVFASETVLKVSAININPAISNDASLIGDLSVIAPFPVLDINSYTQQIINNQVLESAIAVLNLRSENGALIQPESVKRRITVNADEKTNILRVTAKDKTPQAAADLANTLAEQLRVYLTETIKQSCVEVSENVSGQMEAQKEKIDAATERLKAYAEGPRNAQALESAVESLLLQITRYNADLNDIERSIQADSRALASLLNVETGGASAADGVSAGQLKINLPVSGARSRYPAANNDGAAISVNDVAPMEITVESASDIENIMLAVKKAELETRLVQNQAEYDALLASLEVMEEDLSHVTGALAEERQTYDILQRDYLLAGEIYGKYQKIYQQLPVIASSDLARKNIQTLSHGNVADGPENMSALYYAAIGGALGLFMGMFAVLFRNYWMQAQ